MSKTKKILISIFILIFLTSSFIYFKLTTSGFESNYIKEKLSVYILSISEIYAEIPHVYIKLSKEKGLIFEIPSIKSVESIDFHFQDTIIDISIYSILMNGIVDSDIHLDSTIEIQNNKTF